MKRLLLCALALLMPMSAQAQQSPPKLVVVISVDQFSADLFAEYRRHFTGGLARLQQGVVFPSGYQSHAATETCPGHSTILTGNRPGHTGIISNDWYALSAPRAEKKVYCGEDEAKSADYYGILSPIHLKVPTLGDRLKAADPASRVIAVSGKDRAALMMGGHATDEVWWWKNGQFVSLAGRAAPASVDKTNAEITAALAMDKPAMPLPPVCAPHDLAVPAFGRDWGTGRFARKAGDARAFLASPDVDAATLALAGRLTDERQLGRGPAPDVLAVGLSATDYVGHGTGTEGAEMCIQLMQLDAALGAFFEKLDMDGLDYVVVLTADHGGHDLPERQSNRASPEVRIAPEVSTKAVDAAIAAKLKLTGQLLYAPDPFGDIWVSRTLTAKQHRKVMTEAVALYSAMPQVAAVFTHDQLAAAPEPSGPPETWPLLMRAKASFDPERSGDLVVLPIPRIMPLKGGTDRVATHGTPWDNDRRVPILFWRKGLHGFEQPASVETVDILPTLAALLQLPVSGVDGRCLDLDVGPGTTCPN